MHKIKHKLWAKLTMFFVFVISAVVLCFSTLAVIYFADKNAYFDGGASVKNEILEQSLYNKLNDISNALQYNAPYGEFARGEAAAKEHENESSAVSEPTVSASKNKLSVITDSAGKADSARIYEYNSLPEEEIREYLDRRFSSEATNLSVTIKDSEGEVLFENFKIQNPNIEASTTVAVDIRTGQPENISEKFKTREEINDIIDAAAQYGELSCIEIILVPLEGFVSESETPEACEYLLNAVFTEMRAERLTVSAALPEVLAVKDDIYIRAQKVETLVSSRWLISVMIPISLFFLLFSLIFLICSAGYSESEESVHLSLFDKIPLELHLGLYFLIGILIVCLFKEIYLFDFLIIAIMILIGTVFASTVLMLFLMTFAARCKAHKLLITTITFGSFIYMYRICRMIFSNLRQSLKFTLIAVSAFIYDIFCLAMVANGYDAAATGAFMFFAGNAVLFIILCRYLSGIEKIRNGCKKISSGETDAVVPINGMSASLKSFANDVNSIGNGIQIAVEERMKSERLKTELITNVSHDLKTPLTSIVNYVDILSKQDVQPEAAKECVEVLVRQSQKMKKLIDDLVEASKASSGAIPINLERTDMALLLTQAVAEYEERLNKAELTPILQLPENPAPVSVDGRLMWRVFDNLIGNACKYAMPGTRIYISAEEKQGKVYVSFKNISKYALNITTEELMERFVRGDSSRSTEGSGLGLSIARSLCALQNVDFNISIDGDLFKAEMSVAKIIDDEITADESEEDLSKNEKQPVQPAAEEVADSDASNT